MMVLILFEFHLPQLSSLLRICRRGKRRLSLSRETYCWWTSLFVQALRNNPVTRLSVLMRTPTVSCNKQRRKGLIKSQLLGPQCVASKQPSLVLKSSTPVLLSISRAVGSRSPFVENIGWSKTGEAAKMIPGVLFRYCTVNTGIDQSTAPPEMKL